MAGLRLILGPLLYVLDLFLRLYMWVVIARALISWVEPNPYNPIVRTLRSVTDPVLRPFQRLQWRLSKGHMPIDFSPLIVIFLILLIRRFLFQLNIFLVLP